MPRANGVAIAARQLALVAGRAVHGNELPDPPSLTTEYQPLPIG